MSISFQKAMSSLAEAREIVNSEVFSENERVELLQSVTEFASVLEKSEDAVTKVAYSVSYKGIDRDIFPAVPQT